MTGVVEVGVEEVGSGIAVEEDDDEEEEDKAGLQRFTAASTTGGAAPELDGNAEEETEGGDVDGGPIGLFCLK